MDPKIALLEQRVSAILDFRLSILNSVINNPCLPAGRRIPQLNGVYRVAFEKEKELTARALKLAEVGKPKSNSDN